MSNNWYMSLYFRPRNNCLPELIKKDGSRTPLIEIGKTESLMDLIKESFVYKDERPVIIYNGTHYIDNLNKLFISPRHKKILEENPVAFYFFEPLTHYVVKANKDPRLEPHILKIDNETHQLENIRCLELDSLEKWAIEHNLKDLCVYCTDFRCKDYYQQFYPHLKLLEMDLFVSWWSDRFAAFETRTGEIEHEIYVEKITKKFWSGAWRYDPSRHFITAFLAGSNMIENNNVSFYFKVSNEEMKRRLWFPWKEFSARHPAMSETLLKGNEILQQIVPLSIDIDIPVALTENGMDPEVDTNNGANIRKSQDPVETYYECFCAIIQESRVTQPWPNISEKTLNAIKSYRPFVMSGAPGTLKMLKEMGFKTFDNYWPEDYDEIQKNSDRLVRVCETIDYINSFTVEELIEMYKDMIPILEHNYLNLKYLAKFYNDINAKTMKSFH